MNNQQQQINDNGHAKYSAIVCTYGGPDRPQKRFVRYQYVSSERGFRNFVNRRFPEATFYNLFDRATRLYIHTYTVRSGAIRVNSKLLNSKIDDYGSSISPSEKSEPEPAAAGAASAIPVPVGAADTGHHHPRYEGEGRVSVAPAAK